MPFFDKLKQGASDTARKAKQTMEISKLNSHISAKKKEIESSYRAIGEAVFEAFTLNDASLAEELIATQSADIMRNQEDIREAESKILEMRDEKLCDCGKTTELETKFCPHCGHQFA